MVATVGYTRRLKKGNFAPRNILVPTSSYIPLTVTEVNSGKSVTVYNQAPALRGLQDIVYSNDKAFDSTYDGADFSLDKRMSNRWMMTGGVSIGKNIGDIYGGTADLNNPNFTFRQGHVGNDVPFSLRLSGVYEMKWGISASATFQHQVGFPETNQVSVGNNTVALTQGTTAITIEPRGTAHLPDLNQLDASFRKAFRSKGRALTPRLDIYNLANSTTIISRVNTLGSSFGFVNSIQRGRLIKLGMAVDF